MNSLIRCLNIYTEGKFDVWESLHGTGYLATISPLIGTGLNMYMDVLRRAFGVKPAVEGAYRHSDGV